MKWLVGIVWFVIWLIAWGVIGPALDFGTGSPIAHGIGFLVWILILWAGFKLIASAFRVSARRSAGSDTR